MRGKKVPGEHLLCIISSHCVFEVSGSQSSVGIRVVKTPIAGPPHPPPRVSDSIGLWWGLRICLSNEFPDDAEVGDLGPYFENHWSRAVY